MSDETIRAALEAAANECSRQRADEAGGCFSFGSCSGWDAWCECRRVATIDAAAAIAACHRRMAEASATEKGATLLSMLGRFHSDLAAAVERAAEARQ